MKDLNLFSKSIPKDRITLLENVCFRKMCKNFEIFFSFPMCCQSERYHMRQWVIAVAFFSFLCYWYWELDQRH